MADAAQQDMTHYDLFMGQRLKVGPRNLRPKTLKPNTHLNPSPCNTLHTASYTLHPESCALHPRSRTLRPSPHTLLHPPYTLPAPSYTLYPTPYNLFVELQKQTTNFPKRWWTRSITRATRSPSRGRFRAHISHIYCAICLDCLICANMTVVYALTVVYMS